LGLLWYLNFVQTPTVPKIEPAEHRAAITKFIAPNVLFWFRYSALATVVFGLILAFQKGYRIQALTFHKPVYTIGIGMWLALIMAFNVWFIIWPNQKKVLGLVPATPEEKTAAARLAGMTSRINTMLSIPMLYCKRRALTGGMLSTENGRGLTRCPCSIIFAGTLITAAGRSVRCQKRSNTLPTHPREILALAR
jgi:uncharacterized membrane protein